MRLVVFFYRSVVIAVGQREESLSDISWVPEERSCFHGSKAKMVRTGKEARIKN